MELMSTFFLCIDSRKFLFFSIDRHPSFVVTQQLQQHLVFFSAASCTTKKSAALNADLFTEGMFPVTFGTQVPVAKNYGEVFLNMMLF